jgi:anti-anti-sigma regulatory factor
MNHSKNTSLHAIKSVMREAEKGILKTKTLLLTLLASAMIFACTSDEIPEISLSDMLEKGEFIDVSTLSKEHRQTFKKLGMLLISNMKYQDGKMNFTVSEKDITDLGLSESLYEKWRKEIDDVNASLLRDTISKRILDEKFAEVIENAKAQIAEW